MKTQPSPSKPRIGTPGIDIFKIAGSSISGWVPSYKTGVPNNVRLPYMSKLEHRLALYLEYHPHVHFYQRGDASEAFTKAYNLAPPLGTPYRINYTYDSEPHEYLPDFIGHFCDGGLLIAEAGLEDKKSKGKSLAKAEAAQRLAQLKGGNYWIGTEKNLPLSRFLNLLWLHGKRELFKTYHEIASVLLAHWPWGQQRSVKDFIQLLGSRWSEIEIEAAVWKLVGDATAEGRLLVDLTEVELSLSTPLALLEPGSPPILPDPLPFSLQNDNQHEETPATAIEEEYNKAINLQNAIPGPTFDASILEQEESRQRFHRNIAAVTAVFNGARLQQAAKEHEMAPSTLSRLVKRVQELGQIACAPHQTYKRDRLLRPEFQHLIRKLYTHPLRPTVQAVYEDERLKQLAQELSKREGVTILSPTYWQVYFFLKSISHEASVTAARSGLKHPPREKMSPSSFVLSIPFPALICQVDEHTMDLFIVAQDGTVITRHVHAAVLICVKTGAILGAVLALDNLKEEDYMRLIKQAMEPKDRLVSLYECKHSWPCYGKPALIFHDRGKIFTSKHATEVLVDRFKITSEQAPPYAPSAKGTVEAIFGWTTRKFEHRLLGTTKTNPHERGAYDSLREAEKAGITLDVLEKLFIQAIVDDYMQTWNRLRNQTPATLWEHAAYEKGVPRWIGSSDDLKLLLMRSENRKNKKTGRYALKPYQGLSFKGRSYNNEPVLNRLRGKEIDIYYDRRDISVIYLFLEGQYVGEAYCTEFQDGRRVSIWEADALYAAAKSGKKLASDESLEGRQRVQQQAKAGHKVLALETKRLEHKRQYDLQRQDIHTEQVQATLNALAQQKPSLPTKPSVSSFLSISEPEDDPTEEHVIHLPIRKQEDRHD